MRKISILFILFFFIGCAHKGTIKELRYFSAPTVLPNVSTEMKTPGFWINRLRAPDEIIMAPKEIMIFNQQIITSKLREDLSAFPETYDGKNLNDSLKKQIDEIASAGYFTQDGNKAAKEFFASIEQNIGLKNIPETINVQFAIVTNQSDQKFLPTQAILTAKPGDVDFDEMQNNSLDIITPVAVLWQNADHLWSFVVGPSSSGWVLSQNLARCSQDDIKKMPTSDFAVITEAKADIYLDKEQRQFYGYVRMGTRFEIKNSSDEITEIALPLRDDNGYLKTTSGFIRTKDLHRGYLPYTERMIIEQAFEMLNTPYGWGGANGEQDCSQFLQEVFATVGIEIPRNSSDQAKTGTFLYAFDEKEKDQVTRVEKVIAKARPGLSLLYMKGHIMLYLGVVNNIPYAIHDTWAYRQEIGDEDTPMVINKVTVSDLSLGQGSSKGSLVNRLKSIRILE